MRRSTTQLLPRAGPSTLRSTCYSSIRPGLLAHPSQSSSSSSSSVQHRTLFGWFRSKPKVASVANPTLGAQPAKPVLAQDDLFHYLAESPFLDLREKAERIRTVSICPVSVEKYNERVRPNFDCPECGWPTHRSEERWEEGRAEHKEVCDRLREVNEDEHDLRSGRRMTEFENMPSE